MNRFLLYFGIGLAFVPKVTVAQYEPAQWPQHTLKFSEKGTLTDIFDSHLRPYRVPSMEELLLEIKHCRLIVERRTGVRLPELPIEHAQIYVVKGELLTKLELTSAPFTVDDAKTAIEPYLKLNGSSITELEAYLERVKNNPMRFDAPNESPKSPKSPGAVWRDTHGPRGSVHFRASRIPEAPLRIRMELYWTRTRKQVVNAYREPIPPPPGYEEISMKAPREFGPDPVSEIRRGMGIKEKEYNYPGPTERALAGDPKFAWLLKEIQEKNGEGTRPPLSPPANKPKEIERSFPWWYLVIGIIILMTLSIRFLLSRRE